MEAHLLEGRLLPDEEIGIKIDLTLLQDATGTMAMLEFEALGIDRVRVELAAQYVDHNLLQSLLAGGTLNYVKGQLQGR